MQVTGPAPQRPFRLIIGLAVGAAVLSGCSGQPGADDSEALLTSSAEYAQGVGASAARQRSADLRNAIRDLRDDTDSAWVGRQDDVTGYLAEVSGGSYRHDGATIRGLAGRLLARHARTLFGVDPGELVVGRVQQTRGLPVAAVRAAQEHRGLPVRDGELTFSAKEDGTGRDARAITSVRGRVYPGLTVTTRPTISVAQAQQAVLAAAPSAVLQSSRLIVVPSGRGLLAWQISAAGHGGPDPLRTGLDYFVDALTGRMIDARPTTASAEPGDDGAAGQSEYVYQLGPQDVPVTVTGTDPFGRPVKAQALRTAQGITLVDTTVNTYDPTTGNGAVITYSADSTAQIPGRIFTQRGTATEIIDHEAIAAHAFSRATHDYYRSMGWRSWDNRGSTLPAVIHYTEGDDYCNAFFNENVMVYGDVCREGEIMVDSETTGHEVTHGVTESSAGLEYFGQSGALNESFSDYFGNIIGTRVTGNPNDSFSEDSCLKVAHPTRLCFKTPDGMLASRYMLNGRKLSDVAGIVTLPFRYLETQFKGGFDQGGVHLNSAIWNNALWSVRDSLGKRKGGRKLVDLWDRIVFHALTTLITPTDGFVDASRSVEQVARDAGQPVILKAARRSFKRSGFCETCGTDARADGEPVATGGPTQIEPAVNGDRVAWLDSSYWAGVPTQSGSTLPRGQAIGVGGTVDFDFAGDAIITLELSDKAEIVRRTPDGTATTLETLAGVKGAAYAGIDGSADGAVWANQEAHTVSFVDAAGTVTKVAIPPSLDTITSVSTGGGTVGIATASGTILRWQPGQAPVAVSNSVRDVRSTATYGDSIIAVTDAGRAVLFTGSEAVTLDSKAAPVGAALNGRYAVWLSKAGALQGGVAEDFRKINNAALPDYDLRLYSMKTGKFYAFEQRGQQAFPAMSGNRIVWQDAATGTDDVRTDVLPGNL